jgi:hypothetical protein
MEWLGDLERAFAISLFPLRVPIAIGLVGALVALVIVARRRGWLAAARRHRSRTMALTVVALVVALPLGWYLGSPLFIRTSLVEPEPSFTSSAAPSAPPSAAAPTTDPPSAVPTVVPTAAVPTLRPERSGAFSGADEFHFGRGTARLIETAPGSWTVRFEDFSVRNGPDLYVYLSPDPDGYSKAATELGTLKATDGDFNYQVPAGVNVDGARSVVVWCKQFAVLFAVAPLR